MRICLIGANPNDIGGVTKSVRYLVYVYRMLGYDCVWLPSKKLIFEMLCKCDIIHVHSPLGIQLPMILLSRKAKKILTLHGWVLDEAKANIIASRHMLEKTKSLLAYIYVIINWILHKLVLIPFTYDYVTAVSRITARKNSVKALITPNPELCRDIPPHRDHQVIYTSSSKNEIIFITYVSIGGGKTLSIPRLVRVVYLLNQKLGNLGSNKRVVLHIYGKDVPHYIVEKLSKIPYVRFMGYVRDYPERIKEADLFLAGYAFPELGHAALEGMCAGVPIAKFTEDPSQEEIIDGFNGILAFSDEEMIEKLVNYVLNVNKMKNKLANNARNTILKTRDIHHIATMWKIIIQESIIRK